ncbi:hypothetical protein RvY_07885 [Ramazzottius varieornatus]|uniref:XK-related protein n=1 Tax=Ramazzottius varieornatus TaxID=947166 RepID=A0A1D1V3U2_RAMVA|nr:hypothetical protein RvY_07885 [Ramazzottius varieornatus]
MDKKFSFDFNNRDDELTDSERSVTKTKIYPLLTQCHSSTRAHKTPTWFSRLVTWLICRKDAFDIDWTASLANVISTGLFVADLISDLSVGVYHFQEELYGYAGISFAISALPFLVSFGYYKVYKKYPFYLTHPFEPFYWCMIAAKEYKEVVRQRKQPMGPEEAWAHYNSVKNFRVSNWARVSAVRLEVHLEALPQLIFQSYTIAELLHDRDLKNISWFSWSSVAFSTVSLAFYHHTLALAQAKILDKDPDQGDLDESIHGYYFYRFRYSPTILFNFILQGFMDALYVVARAVALAVAFTVAPYPWLDALVFITVHLSIVYGMMWLAGPKSANKFLPDFRLILYNRTNHPDILTAAAATLVFPPLMDATEDETASNCVDYLLTSGTKTFWITGGLQVLETLALLLFWFRLNADHIQLETRVISMGVVLGIQIAVLLFHVLITTCILMPFKRQERQLCTRKKGILAKCWLLEMAEVHHKYLEEVIMPRLTNTGFVAFTRKTSGIDITHTTQLLEDFYHSQLSPSGSENTLTMEDLNWLTDTLLVVTNSSEHPKMLEYSKWQRRHFFRTITTEESQLTNEIAEYAKRQLKDVMRFGAVYDTEVKEPLIQGCKRLIAFWSDVVFRCITHQELPDAFSQIVPQDGVRQIASWYSDAVKEPIKKKRLPAISIFKRKLDISLTTKTRSESFESQSFTTQTVSETIYLPLPSPEKQTKRETLIWD